MKTVSFEEADCVLVSSFFQFQFTLWLTLFGVSNEKHTLFSEQFFVFVFKLKYGRLSGICLLKIKLCFNFLPFEATNESLPNLRKLSINISRNSLVLVSIL